MNHDEISDLLGAYALDAVDDAERVAVDAHLDTCARCRAEVAEHRETATLLAHAGSDAPEGLWQRISDELDPAPPAGRPAPALPGTPAAARTRALPRALNFALAAAIVAVALLGVQVNRQDDRIDGLQTALERPLVPAFEQALAAPGSREVELVSDDGELKVRGVVTGDRMGFLRVDDLPTLDPDRTYQLWGVNGEELVSLSVFDAAAGIVTFRAAAPYEAFAVTEEEAPGVVVSEAPAVVAGGYA